MAGLKNLTRCFDLRGMSTLLATLLAIPMAWKGLTGFYTWLSPYIMLNSVFALKSVVWLNLVAFTILLLSVLRKRWFCRYLCPAGWGCDWVSSHSLRKGFSVRKIPHIGKWMAILSLFAALAGFPLFILLDPISIFNGFFAAFGEKMSVVVLLSLSGFPILLFVHLFFPGIWCSRLCPLGGLLDELIEIRNLISVKLQRKEEHRKGTDIRRRLFLASGTGLLAGFMVPALFAPEKRAFFRPPGSVPSRLFNLLCLRCGSCIKACPTNILHHRTDPVDVMAWMVPEIRFSNGYCLEKCNLCSRVCSSGAITLFSPDAKSQLKIGIARVEAGKCLLTQNTECDHCKTACSYSAIAIEGEHGNLHMKPVVHPGKCNGCGACAVICPAEAIVMVPM
jgi:ferredoxin-type protein NapF